MPGLLGNTAELAILLKLKDEFSGPMKSADSQLQGLHSRVGQIGTGVATMGKGLAVAAERIAMIGVAAGVAVGGIAVSAMKSAASFSSAMNLIQTQAGASAQEVTDMSKAVLAMAGSVGSSPDVLATGLYHIESAGIRGAQALDVLKTAAQGAAVGGSDLESTTNALIATVKSGVGGITSMSQGMGVLNGIVGNGNMRMQDLVDALGTGLLTKAKTFGVSIQSVGAALASMTNQGVPAVQAATEIGSAFRLMAAPTSKAAKELESIGLGQLDLANAMRGPTGMVGAIELLGQKMSKAGLLDKSGNPTAAGADLLTKAFGGKQSTAILALVGDMAKIPGVLDAINKSSGGFGDAFATKAAEVDFKVGAVRGQLDALKITLGERLLPVAGTILDEVSKVLGSPAAISAADQMGQAIAGIFSQENISKAEQFVGQVAIFAHQILPPLIDGLKIAGQITSTAISAFTSLPAPLQAMIIGGLAVNKLSGGLIATGLKQVAQGLVGGGGGAGGGVVGGLLGVQKVFVVNMPAGGLGGGGLGNAAESALGGGALAAGLTVAAGAAVGGVAIDQYMQTSNQADAIAAQTGDFVKVATLAQLQAARQSVADGAKQLMDQQWYNPFAAAAEGGLNKTLAQLNEAIAAKVQEATNAARAGERGDMGANSPVQDFNAFRSGERGTVGAGHLGAQIGAAMKQPLKASAVDMAHGLTSAFKESTGPSLHSMTSALDRLRALQEKFVAQGDTKLAAQLNSDIKYLSGRVDQVRDAVIALSPLIGALGTQTFQTFRQGERGDVVPKKIGTTTPIVSAQTGFTLNAHVNVSARQNNQAATIGDRYGPTSAGGQAVRSGVF